MLFVFIRKSHDLSETRLRVQTRLNVIIHRHLLTHAISRSQNVRCCIVPMQTSWRWESPTRPVEVSGILLIPPLSHAGRNRNTSTRCFRECDENVAMLSVYLSAKKVRPQCWHLSNASVLNACVAASFCAFSNSCVVPPCCWRTSGFRGNGLRSAAEPNNITETRNFKTDQAMAQKVVFQLFTLKTKRILIPSVLD